MERRKRTNGDGEGFTFQDPRNRRKGTKRGDEGVVTNLSVYLSRCIILV